MKIIKRTATTALFAAIAMAAGCMEMDDMPTPPSDLTAAELAGGVHLTWKDNSSNEASFMVERKAGTGSFAELITVPFDTTAHHDTGGLTAGTAYVYRVMAMPKSGGHSSNPQFSNEAMVTYVGQ